MNNLEYSKIFFAGSLTDRKEIARMAKLLREAGYRVTSTWHDTYDDQAAEFLYVQMMASVVNIADLDDADLVVIFSKSPSTTGATYYEHGYAIAHHKRIVLIGEPRNIYMRSNFMKFDNQLEFIVAFKNLRKNMRK